MHMYMRMHMYMHMCMCMHRTAQGCIPGLSSVKSKQKKIKKKSTMFIA